MDGSYMSSFPMRLNYADAVIFLDIHPGICLYRLFKRQLNWFFYKNLNTLPRQIKTGKITTNIKGLKYLLPLIVNYRAQYKNIIISETIKQNKKLFICTRPDSVITIPSIKDYCK